MYSSDNLTSNSITLGVVLQAVSHLPVSVVAILAPDLIGTDALQQQSSLSPDTTQALNETLVVLEKTRELVTEENFPNPGQVSFIGTSNSRIGRQSLDYH